MGLNPSIVFAPLCKLHMYLILELNLILKPLISNVKPLTNHLQDDYSQVIIHNQLLFESHKL